VPGSELTGQGGAPASRRRGETLERATYTTVIDQLQAAGYGALTMEGIAAEARTGKAALYRRWPGKAQLVADALDHALPAPEDDPDTGNVRDDLVEHLRQKAAALNSRVGRAVQSLLAEIDRDRPLIRLVQERVFEPRQNVFGLIIQRAAEPGRDPGRPRQPPSGRPRSGDAQAALPRRPRPGARRVPGSNRGRADHAADTEIAGPHLPGRTAGARLVTSAMTNSGAAHAARY
jgi:AcrR family transcriptional regulator